jgi:hypothetical protein
MIKPSVSHPLERLAATGALRPMPPIRRRRLDAPALVGLLLGLAGLAAFVFVAVLP